jgi:carboxypeptidase C (cathepsin A)
MHERLSDSSIIVLPKVLARIPVLLFAGDQDLICNYVGLEAMIQAMEWNGAKGLGVRGFLRSLYPSLTIHTTDRADAVLERRRGRGRDMGYIPEFDIR